MPDADGGDHRIAGDEVIGPGGEAVFSASSASDLAFAADALNGDVTAAQPGASTHDWYWTRAPDGRFSLRAPGGGIVGTASNQGVAEEICGASRAAALAARIGQPLGRDEVAAIFESEECDAAFAYVQVLMGVEEGDVAAQWFSGDQGDRMAARVVKAVFSAGSEPVEAGPEPTWPEPPEDALRKPPSEVTRDDLRPGVELFIERLERRFQVGIGDGARAELADGLIDDLASYARMEANFRAVPGVPGGHGA